MGYTVTDVREVRQMSPSGQPKVSYRVWLTTDRGAMGTIDVSEKDYTAENLPPLLQAKAETLDLAFTVQE